MVTLPLFGGCACGQVRYRVDALPGESGYCHCRTCQRCASAPAVPWVMVPLASLQYLSGEVRVFHSSAQGERRFCQACGTYLEYRERDQDSIGLSSMTLDQPEWFPPQKHIWYASRVPWFEPGDDLPRFDQDR